MVQVHCQTELIVIGAMVPAFLCLPTVSFLLFEPVCFVKMEDKDDFHFYRQFLSLCVISMKIKTTCLHIDGKY